MTNTRVSKMLFIPHFHSLLMNTSTSFIYQSNHLKTFQTFMKTVWFSEIRVTGSRYEDLMLLYFYLQMSSDKTEH